MYCSKCGTLLSDESVFCFKCGAKVAVDAEGVQNQRNPENDQENGEQSETAELLKNLEVALPIYQRVAEYDARIQQLSSIRAKKLPFKVGLLIAFGVFVTALFLAVLVGSIFGSMSGETLSTLTVIFIIVIFVGLTVLQSKKSSNIYQEIQKIQQELDEYIYQNQRPELFYLPEPYQYYLAANYIRDCIVNKRASNLTEAINLFEDQLHKWQMENYQQMIYQTQLQQAAILRYRR